LQTNDLFLSYNIQFMYEYYAIEKQEIFCMLSMLPLRLAVERVNMLLRMFNRLSADEV